MPAARPTLMPRLRVLRDVAPFFLPLVEAAAALPVAVAEVPSSTEVVAGYAEPTGLISNTEDWA